MLAIGYQLSGVSSGRSARRSGFTLIELLLAVTIMAVAMSVTCLTFSTATKAWQRGTALSDNLHHGDFVAEQLAMGLRSMYYPDTKGRAPAYGFCHEDNGDSEHASDTISWVKLGGALVGENCRFAGTPHRVKFTIEHDDTGERSVAVRAWRTHGQPEGFDPSEIEPTFLSRRVTGFSCRAAYLTVEDTDEPDWLDLWEQTNHIPTVVEITLYMLPLEEGGDSIEVKRIVGIPVGPLGRPKS